MLLIRRQRAWLSEHTHLTVGTTGGEEGGKRSRTRRDVKSVSSAPPQLVLLVGRQIRNEDEATRGCLLWGSESAAVCVLVRGGGNVFWDLVMLVALTSQ